MSDPRSEQVYFSRQLSGWIGHFLFTLTVALTIFALIGAFRGAFLHLLALLVLLLVYASVGTWGWRRVLQSRSTSLVIRYFIGQVAFVALLMSYELLVGIVGLSTSILGIGLMVQAAVLPRRARIGVFATLLAVTVVLYGQSMASVFTLAPQLFNYALIFGLLYAIGLFLGLLIVREERAREISLRLDESNRKLAQYAAEVELLSTIQERNRLAREIHDNLGHYLTAVNMQLEVAQVHLPPDHDSLQTALDKAQSLTKDALSEIRRSISALRATPLENRTLPEAIGLLVDEHRAAGNVVDFQVIGAVRPCSAVVEMAVYRVAQEGLTNIRKHAHATRADLTLTYADAAISLTIRDDGQGSDQSDGGFGLLGIRERVQLLGGTVSIKTAKGQGFTLIVSIPTSP